MTSHALKAHCSSSLMSFQFSILSTCLSLFCFVYIHINRSGFEMQIPLSKSVALSMMIVSSHLCRTWCIHIDLHHTWLHFYRHLLFRGWLHSRFKYFFILFILLHTSRNWPKCNRSIYDYMQLF